MADPLSQLRQYHINRREIKETNDYIVFGDHGWPKNVHTNYSIYSSAEDTNKKEYYTLECLLYFLKNKTLLHHHYVKQAGREEKPVVHRPDRKNLLAYLEGEAQIAPAIDKNAPIPTVRLPLSEIVKKSSSQPIVGEQQADLKRGISDDFATPTASAQKRPHDPEMEKKYREEFAAKLYEPSTKKLATVMPSENADKAGESAEGSAAISKFGPEKLAAMRAKHLAVKRTTIIDADESTKPGSAAADSGTKEDLLISMDAEKYKIIKSKEKVWRTRSSILQSQTKNFQKSVLPMLNLLTGKFEEIPSLPNDPLMGPPGAANATSSHHHTQQPANTYSRYDQERFVKLDIEIDTKKSFVSSTPQASTPKPVVPQPRLGPPPISSNHRSTSRPTSAQPPPARSKRVSTVPIIIIPATNTSLINMYNASNILQDLTYVEGRPGNKARDNEIMIQRKKSDGTSAFYKIMDNPTKLDTVDWNRVVAVFVQGPAWQFKDWPWGGSPVEIFSRIKAFHLKWDEQRLDDNVSKWNVDILELSRSKRHLDKANLLKFWSSLDAYMTKFKSYLKF